MKDPTNPLPFAAEDPPDRLNQDSTASQEEVVCPDAATECRALLPSAGQVAVLPVQLPVDHPVVRQLAEFAKTFTRVPGGPGAVEIAAILVAVVGMTRSGESGNSSFLLPLPALPEGHLFLERFPETSGKKTMAVLKGIFATGCAFKGGAKTLGEAVAWLKDNHCLVPYAKSYLSAYLKKGSELFDKYVRQSPKDCPGFLHQGTVQLDLREGDEPLRHPNGWLTKMDTRPIIDLTAVGWWAWEEIGKFVRRHDPTLWGWASALVPK